MLATFVTTAGMTTVSDDSTSTCEEGYYFGVAAEELLLE